MALFRRLWILIPVALGVTVGFALTVVFGPQILHKQLIQQVLAQIENESLLSEINDAPLLAETASDLSVSSLPANLTLSVTNLGEPQSSTGVVLSVDAIGQIILVEDQTSSVFSTTVASSTTVEGLPSGDQGAMVYKSANGWLSSTKLFHSGDKLGLATIKPKAKFHIDTESKENIGLIVQGYDEQTTDLTQWWDEDDRVMLGINNNGKMTFYNQANDHAIEIIQTGNAGYLSSDAGAIRIDNTGNLGAGLSIYSNAGGDALGNMINVKVDNPAYQQAAFYMNYDGISNAVEIISNTNDTSSNALSVTNYNTQDSAVGIIGYETSRGTIKVTHNGTGNDSSASGLSIDLKGSGTKAQGLYVDSTETGGTTGNLLRLRNESIDRFVVNYLGATTIGSNGTNTSITKHGNVSGDEFFVGTTGAFRVQRSATDSEAFRVQINGDTQGRWLGTSDGKLKWGDGSSSHDVILRRSAAQTLLLDGAIFEFESPSTNSDVSVWTASDGSRLGRIVETSGGHGWFEIDNSSGTAAIVLRADGGNSYVNSGNFGVGTTSFGTSAAKVLALGNGTAPTTSITDGIQLYAIDYDDGDASATSELFVRDEDGNATNLSPHNFSLIPTGASEPLAWSFYSTKDSMAINVDMTRAVRLVENLSGQKLVYLKDLDSGESIDFEPEISFQVESVASISSRLTNTEQTLETISSRLDQIWGGLDLDSDNQMLKIVYQAFFQAKVIFQDTVEFASSVIFQEDIRVAGDVDVQGELKVDSRQAGRAVIQKGSKQVTVIFSSPLSTTPVVTTSANSFIESSYRVTYKTNLGFMIELSSSESQDIEFDWIAVASDTPPSITEDLEVVESAPEVASGSGQLAE